MKEYHFILSLSVNWIERYKMQKLDKTQMFSLVKRLLALQLQTLRFPDFSFVVSGETYWTDRIS